MTEPIQIALISVASMLLLKFTEWLLAQVNQSKVKAENRQAAQEAHISNLEKRIEEVKGIYERRIEDLSTRFSAEISALRNENVKLQIAVAEYGVKLTIKDETIIELREKIQGVKTRRTGSN